MRRWQSLAVTGVAIGLMGSGTPPWSIKLDAPQAAQGRGITIIDRRLPKEKEFRTIDFWKLSYQTFLGDRNTKPDRIAFLEGSLNALAPDQLAGATVEVSKFEIFHDQSGSACLTCATTAVIPAIAVVPASPDGKFGDDHFECRLEASIGGSTFAAKAGAAYHVSAFQGIRSKPVAAALQTCLEGVVREWLLAATPQTAELLPVAPEDRTRAEQEMCEKVACVFDVRIALKNKDGTPYDQSFHSLPVVQPNGVSVYAGQTVHFEATAAGGRLTDFVLVPTVREPSRTVSATLSQAEDGSMMLTLSNPFDRTLKVGMAIMPLEGEGLSKTSSCPVIPGGTNYEFWPSPLFQVWLGEMRLLEVDGPQVCTE